MHPHVVAGGSRNASSPDSLLESASRPPSRGSERDRGRLANTGRVLRGRRSRRSCGSSSRTDSRHCQVSDDDAPVAAMVERGDVPLTRRPWKPKLGEPDDAQRSRQGHDFGEPPAGSWCRKTQSRTSFKYVNQPGCAAIEAGVSGHEARPSPPVGCVRRGKAPAPVDDAGVRAGRQAAPL